MGLPINFAFTEPQTDEAFQWGGSKTEPVADSFDFAETGAESDGLQMEGVEIGIVNGLAMEGVEVGIIAGSSALAMEPLDESIAAPSDQDLLTWVDEFTPQDTSESCI